MNEMASGPTTPIEVASLARGIGGQKEMYRSLILGKQKDTHDANLLEHTISKIARFTNQSINAIDETALEGDFGLGYR
jgi:hypothetical protein